MAERPDLEYWVAILDTELRGREIRSVSVHKPVVLRQAVPGALDDVLGGRRIEGVSRRGPFVRFELAGEPRLDIVVSPMLAGRFEMARAGAKARKDLAVSFGLDDGRELRYRDEVQMGKVYVARAGDDTAVPGLSDIGLDILDPTIFTFEAFATKAKGRRDQVRVFLMDKSAIDSLGNAYADEVLFAAGVHPKTWVRSLSEDELHTLHQATARVVREASERIAAEKPALDVKLRDFLSVRGRHKAPCPRCTTPIRKAGVRGFDSYFCPSCQPETRKSSIVDWGSTGRGGRRSS